MSRTPYLLAALAGVLYVLGQVGFDLWPLAFVALVPVLVAMGSPEADARKKFGLAVETPEAVANGATAGTTEQP